MKVRSRGHVWATVASGAWLVWVTLWVWGSFADSWLLMGLGALAMVVVLYTIPWLVER